MTTAYANARSLLVYFILFMLAQVFTVILVVDAVSTSYIRYVGQVTNQRECRSINVIQFNLLRWSLLN